MRQWLLRSLRRQGIWGSGLDTLLTRLRSAIKDYGATGFPRAKIEQAMAELGKSLAFDEDAVQGLLRIRYGDPNCFCLLSLIYPSGDTSRRHIDHVFPQTAFAKGKLATLGVSPEVIAWMLTAAQEVPNLQLLTPAENESKGGQLPSGWLAGTYSDGTDNAAVRAFHHLGQQMESLSDFKEFFVARQTKLAAVVRSRLGIAGEGSSLASGQA